MMKKLVTLFNNLKLRYKILLSMVIITTFSILFINIMSYKYFSNSMEKDAKNNTTHTLEIASQTLSNSLNNILYNTNSFVSSTFKDTLIDISRDNQDDYIDNYINLQDGLSSLIKSNELIDTIIILGKNGEFFSLGSIGIKYDFIEQSDWDFSNLNGITLLPFQKNPLTKIKNVIPLVIPISSLGPSNLPIITGSVEDSIATIIIFLDNNRINELFSQINKNKDSVIYLADANGLPLSLDSSDNYKEISNDQNLKNNIRITPNILEFEMKTNNDTYIVTSKNVNVSNLKTVNIISKDSLLKELNNIQYIIVFTWVFSFLLAFIFSILLAHYLTRPLVSLLDVVSQIKDNTYTVKSFPNHKDEIGFLHNEINSMYDTILAQIEQIKADEKQKLQDELTILTEQLNPHFLYNTLDCIRWEILSGNTDASATMVETLATFLRIELNNQNTLISIENEIRHVQAYLEIMNYRSNDIIELNYQVDESLKDYKILRLILQPLIENSIKHGFTNYNLDPNIFSCQISINITSLESMIQIEVNDNGKGIDIDNANAALYGLSDGTNKKHIGLRNVYQRLNAYYGDSIKIGFISIPYIKNSVIISLPKVED